MGVSANYYAGQYEVGNRDVIRVLAAEEPNLLNARSLARSNRWSAVLVRILQGLRVLYQHTGRKWEWSSLVDEIVPDFVDPATQGPLPGKEEEWTVVTEYRVRLARAAGRLDEAARLQSLDVHWNRLRAAAVLAKQPSTWGSNEKNSVRSLAASLEEVGHIERERGSAACVDSYMEALALEEQIPDAQASAICSFNLGMAYQNIAEIRDLALAERWVNRSMELHSQGDHMGHARCLVRLGSIDYDRFQDARKTNRPREECERHLSKAEKYYRVALQRFPTNAVEDLEFAYHLLGTLYSNSGLIEAALYSYGRSIQHSEAMQDRFKAGETRRDVAVALANVGRFADAREWAQCALRDYQACENADAQVVITLKLLEQIESALQATSPRS
jgi:tetratricopeptide (TPR) repeat protein